MAEIILYGIIGDPFDKLDAKRIAPLIRAASGPLTLRINSPGGYVMEGLAIIAAIRDYRGKVTAYVDGLAASMASTIAAACDEVVMAEASMLMIHNPWDCACGDAPELRAAADQLDRIRDQLVGIYAKRAGLDAPALVAMLDAETWMTADQAVELGFADRIAPDLKIAAMANVTAFGFRNPPEQLKETTVTVPSNDTAQAVTLERTRISTIMALGTKHRLPNTLTQDLIDRGIPLADARASILDHLAAEGDRQGIGHGAGSGAHNSTTLDNPATYGAAVRDALVAKISGRAAEGAAAEFQGMAPVDIARDYLSRNGVRDVMRMSPDRVLNTAMTSRSHAGSWGMGSNIGGMHTTSDFPDLVGGAAEKYLIDRYIILQSPLKKLGRQSTRANFLMQYGVQMDGGLGALDTVDEAGEFKNRSLSTRKEGYALKTYGNLFSVSRQMLVNDSLGALGEILNIMAQDAADTEALVLAAIINNYVMLDGKAWFHAEHKNLAPAGSLLSIDSLDQGRMAMRSQKTASGGLIDAKPKYLVVPVALETKAEVLVASTIAPTSTADVNVFAGKLEVIADPRLTNPTAWFLFADPNFSPALEYAYLNGQATPFTDSQDGWRVDGTEYKVRHDFGAGALDSRLAWKNPGA